MSVPDYKVGDKAWAAIGTTKIKGLNAIKVPGMTRKSVEVTEFDRDIDFSVPTSAAWETGSIAGNYVRDDTTGQKVLRTKLFNNEGLDNLRLYEDLTNFWAPDLATDENSQVYVMGNPGPEIAKADLIPFSCELLVQGSLALFDAHVTGATLAFTGTTITDSADGFVTAGFEAGQTIIIEGSPTNDVHTKVVIDTGGVAAGVLTLTSGSDTLTVENGDADCKVHGGTF